MFSLSAGSMAPAETSAKASIMPAVKWNIGPKSSFLLRAEPLRKIFIIRELRGGFLGPVYVQ